MSFEKTFTCPISQLVSRRSDGEEFMKIRYLSASGLILTLFTNVAAADLARVMVVHSYEKNHICGAPQARGLMEALAERGWSTDNAFEGVREECLDAGMDDYLSKPVSKEELQQLITDWLRPESRRHA